MKQGVLLELESLVGFLACEWHFALVGIALLLNSQIFSEINQVL